MAALLVSGVSDDLPGRRDLAEGLEGPVHFVGVPVLGSPAPGGGGSDLMDLDLAGETAGDEVPGPARAIHLEDDDVGLDLGRVEADRGTAHQPFGEAPGMDVVLDEPIHHRVERYQPRGGEHADLAHAPAQRFPDAPPTNDQAARAADNS